EGSEISYEVMLQSRARVTRLGWRGFFHVGRPGGMPEVGVVRDRAGAFGGEWVAEASERVVARGDIKRDGTSVGGYLAEV
ncbi:MAG: hypothetical protein ACQKBU_08195, partial [Verrucomicrobiales bacterium]